VTCTAKDASNNMSTCTFGVNVYSFCLQDDSNPGDVVFVNAITGDFVVCSSGEWQSRTALTQLRSTAGRPRLQC
jgi:hypothetical protein